MNEFLAIKPFDLYELQLLRWVASSGSFTRAAEQAGLTQSAVTRQVQGVEYRLGVELFKRTTRKVTLTDAGRFLLAESGRIAGDVESLTQRMQQEFGNIAPEIRLGLSRSLGLACYPGFLFANRRAHPETLVKVWQNNGQALLQKLEEGALDVVVVSKPSRLPGRFRVVHQFEDAFVLITSSKESPSISKPSKLKNVLSWAQKQPWILLHEESSTGAQLRRWIKKQRLIPEVIMEADNFDLIINLVALGYGSSFVPHRALALYTNKRGFKRIQLKDRFSRDMVVLVRKQRKPAAHITQFINEILF